MFLLSSCSCLCPIYLSNVLSWEWRCSWSSADRRCSNYIWVINNLIAYWGAPYIRDLTVVPNIYISKDYFDGLVQGCCNSSALAMELLRSWTKPSFEVWYPPISPGASFYWHGLTLIPAWISNYIHYKVWDESIFPFPKFNSSTI